MAQQFDPEVYKQLKGIAAELRDGAASRLPGAVDNIKEQAEQNGLPVLISSCTNAAEVGVPAFVKAVNELLDLVDEYCQKAAQFFDAFGIEYQ